MASTSSASAKHGERTQNMQRHHGAGARLSNYNYKLHEDSAKLAKRSQKLLCSPAVELRHLLGQHKRRSDAPAADLPRMRNAAGLRQTGSVLERPASTPSSTPYRDVYAEHRAAAFPVETVGTLPIPVYFMRSVGSTVAVFFWETRTRPTS
jgi:hypothetical protein